MVVVNVGSADSAAVVVQPEVFKGNSDSRNTERKIYIDSGRNFMYDIKMMNDDRVLAFRSPLKSLAVVMDKPRTYNNNLFKVTKT